MKAILAYNYNIHPSKSDEISIGGPTSAFRPYLVVDPPPEKMSPIICEKKSLRKDAFRKIKIMFGLS
jgi:hypothetical protein